MLQQDFEPDKDDGAAADDHHDPLAGQGAEADADQHADGGGRRSDHPHGEGGDPDAGTGERQPCSHCQRIQTGGDCRQKEGARSEEIRRAAGLRAILSRLLLLFSEPFENHFSADESEQREGEPVVHGADHVLQQRGRGESEERHEDLKAAEKVDYFYTDVWVSMGFEAEQARRMKIFRLYQVNAELFKVANPDAKFLHCLPAHRGEEVSAEVMDSPRSIVFDEAENRLHVQKAIMAMLMK